MDAPARTPRRLLVVSPWEDFWSMPGKAGVSDDAEFTRRALEAGHTLHFVVPEGGRFHPEEEHERLHVHTFPNPQTRYARLPTPLRRLLVWRAYAGPIARRALAVARKVEPELVLGLSYYGARGAERVGKELNIPSVVKHFGVYTAAFFRVWPRWKYLWKNLEILAGLNPKVDRLIVLNDGSLGKEAAVRAGFPEDRISFLLNGIHTEWGSLEFDREAERARLGVEPGEAVVLFLARLAHFKGTAQLMRVLPRLLSAAKVPVRVLIAGSGEDEDWMKREAAALPRAERVRFLGAVPHEEVPPLFAAADCFLTINTYSNMAIPTCEAMVLGCPVVATDVTGTAETVKDGVNGLLVPEGDDDALVAALRRILERPDERARLAAGARAHALANFDSWDRRVGRELDLIEELIQKGRTLQPRRESG